VLAPEAIQYFRRLPSRDRALVRDAIEKQLRYQPNRVSKSRIKRLRGLSKPQYRLRVGEMRVFYDVDRANVLILAIIYKPDAEKWLTEERQQS
jgi:mRNA interferase RelE/StbE